MVLEEFPAAARQDPPPVPAPRLLVLSAHDEARLRDTASRLATWLRRPDGAPLADVAWTLQTGREPLRERLALVVGDEADAAARLAEFAAGRDPDAASAARGRAPHGGRPQGRLLPEPDPDLTALARHWVSGGPVDWTRLYTGSAPRPSPPCRPTPSPRCAAGSPSRTPPADPPPSRTRVPAVTPRPRHRTPRDIELLRREWLPTGEAADGERPAKGAVVCLYGTADPSRGRRARPHGTARRPRPGPRTRRPLSVRRG
ncbi:hypothetical protein SVIOM342S_05265 [Streptomyces violaceorubidus]